MFRLSRLLAALTLVALVAGSMPARAQGLGFGGDIGDSMDIASQDKGGPTSPAKKTAKPAAKPTPATKKSASVTAKPGATTTAMLPPKSEKRLRPNEVLVETKTTITPAQLT